MSAAADLDSTPMPHITDDARAAASRGIRWMVLAMAAFIANDTLVKLASATLPATRRGASKLLRAAPRHFAAYDDYLCDGSAHGARVLDVAPMPVEQEKLESSVFDPHLAGFRPLSPAARAWFAVRRLRRRLRLRGRWRRPVGASSVLACCPGR